MIHRIVVLGGLCVVAAACGGDEPAASSSGTATATASMTASPAKSAVATAPTASAKPAPTGAELKIDAEGQKLVKAVVDNCTVTEEDADVKDCKNKEDEAFYLYARDKKPPNLIETVADMAVNGADKKTRAAAMNMIPRMLNADFDWFKKTSTKAAGERMVELAESAGEDGKYLIPEPMVACAISAGMEKELATALGKRKPDSMVLSMAVRYYIRWGGAAVLPTVDELAKSSSEKVRYAAVAGAGTAAQLVNIGAARPQLPEADRGKVCDWAKKYLEDTDEQRADGAGEAMGECRGAYIDAALDAVEKRAKGKPSFGLAQLPHHLCWASGIVGGAVNGTPEQCARAIDVSEKLIENPELKGENLRVAVWGVGSIGKYGNQKDKAKKLLTKLTSHSDKTASEAAKSGLKDLDK